MAARRYERTQNYANGVSTDHAKHRSIARSALAIRDRSPAQDRRDHAEFQHGHNDGPTSAGVAGP